MTTPSGHEELIRRAIAETGEEVVVVDGRTIVARWDRDNLPKRNLANRERPTRG